MEVTLDTSPVKLPRLTDVADAAVPSALTDAHKALATLANEAVAHVTAIKANKRISESERTSQLAAVSDAFTPEAAKLGEVVATVAALASEAERAALNKSVARFDPQRMLAVATAIAARPKPERVAALLRARHDAETASAIVGAPAELGITADVDPRVLDALRDTLIDPTVRKTVSDTAFACSRLRVGIEAATATLRRLSGTSEVPATRIRRVR
jgi:hypothetical protein